LSVFGPADQSQHRLRAGFFLADARVRAGIQWELSSMTLAICACTSCAKNISSQTETKTGKINRDCFPEFF